MSKTGWHPYGEIPPLTKDPQEHGREYSAPLYFFLGLWDMQIITGHFERTDHGDDWVGDDGSSYNSCITHWAFLPEPPEAEA